MRNAQTDTINPLKLRELLSSGRPIAATGLPEIVRAYGPLVPTGDGVASFIVAIEAALGSGPEDAARRQAAVAGDDCGVKAKTLLDFIAATPPRA